ncbi:restriction endonuclease subunit S [Endozoicomonas sp. SCSIO W0465]|uniref:restriction endonuclease subunit S n=1 Tax=Endozoicomonas sp. SCSIO W0465 TaxID=2918516 RepID=UPI002075AAA1|nr:restriction endonuclease subunit S [Endozoicomonas sp. SCSIO W0465]USE36596.1 restriction endonuclease subunit S [Endozoicomonas sp. SCSIO W0465]
MLTNTVVLDTKEKITELGLQKSTAKLWPKHSTIVAMYGATAGQVCLISQEMAANQACCALIPKQNYSTYIFLSARRSIEDLASKASGSAQQNLNKSLVSEHRVINPAENILKNFEKNISSLISKWEKNIEESRALEYTRDTLLPKLLSGEISVKDEVKEAVYG